MKNILTSNIDENINAIKETLNDCDDIIYRRIELGSEDPLKVAIIFTDGLVNNDYISDYIIRALFNNEKSIVKARKTSSLNVLHAITKEAMSVSEIEESINLDEILLSILSGDTILLIDNIAKGIIVSTKQFPNRSVDEPRTETVIRGPRDGFIESFKMNTSLIRRRIRDTNLKLKIYNIGRRSQTTVGVMYIEDIANPQFLDELDNRLKAIDIDVILDSSILENLIEDNYLSAFPQIENTERPDAAASAIIEGRIVIVVDNSPFVLIIPATLGTLLQSTEDYYTRWPEASTIRLLRILAVFLSLLAPALYVAITAYHPGLLPTKLVYFLAASRIDVPFPSVVEATLMELTIELIREAGTRISGPVGTTIGIVGGLIIGQAAVEAGIVSPLMIIIVAITTISGFVIPSYELAAAFRVGRFVFIALAAVFGLYGIMLGVILLSVHLAKMNSFGVPYTSPYAGYGIKEGELKDTLIKAPIQDLRFRPSFTSPKNKRRMRRR